MMNFLKNKQSNYLLKTGIIFFLVSFFISIWISYLGLDTETSRLRNSHNFYNFVLQAVIFAPVVEELIFRGFFSKYKFLRFLYFIGIPIIVLYVQNYYVLFLFVPHSILYILKIANNFKYPNYFDYFINALLFSLVHFQFSDINISTVFEIFIRFGSGLVFIWVMLNFGIIKAILVHLINNLLGVLIIFFAIQFPDQTQHTVDFEGYTMEWKQVPIIGETKGMTISYNDSTLYAKRIGLYNLCQIYNPEIISDSLRIPFHNQMTLYEIEIFKDDSVKIKLKEEVFGNLLLKAELLVPEKPNP